MELLRNASGIGKEKPTEWPIAPFDSRDHFDTMGAATSLTVAGTRSLAGLHNTIMDSDMPEAAKAAARVAIGTFTTLGITSFSILETISRIALSIIAVFAISAFSCIEILFKVTVNATLYIPLGICKAVGFVLIPCGDFILSKLGIKEVLGDTLTDLGIAKVAGSIFSAISYIGEDLQIFDFPLLSDERGEILQFLYASAIINAKSISIGPSMGIKMITHHDNLNFKNFVWRDSRNEAFSLYNFVFDF